MKELTFSDIKIGGTYRVRKDLSRFKYYSGCNVCIEMEAYRGQIVTVVNNPYEDRFELYGINSWVFTAPMLEPVEEVVSSMLDITKALGEGKYLVNEASAVCCFIEKNKYIELTLDSTGELHEDVYQRPMVDMDSYIVHSTLPKMFDNSFFYEVGQIIVPKDMRSFNNPKKILAHDRLAGNVTFCFSNGDVSTRDYDHRGFQGMREATPEEIEEFNTHFLKTSYMRLGESVA
jgi:hypothetical protein